MTDILRTCDERIEAISYTCNILTNFKAIRVLNILHPIFEKLHAKIFYDLNLGREILSYFLSYFRNITGHEETVR